MSFNFVIPQFNINGTGTPPLQFFRRGFNLNGSGGSEPSWKDIILHGVTALTLVNSKANGLNYLKLFGGTEQLPETYIDSVTLDGKCEQSGTPTPDSPVDIVCNNGAIKYSLNELNPSEIELGYYRVSTTGVLTESPYNFITGYMPVKPDQSYVFYGRRKSDNKLSAYNRIHWFDANKEFISTNTYTINRIGTGIAPSNAYFAQCSCNESGGTTSVTTQKIVDGYNWIFELGTTEMPYTPYVEGGLYIDGTTETATDNVGNVATAEMLLSVGDVKDVQSVLDGVITKNVGILILDGTESWQVATGTGFKQFYSTNTQGIIANSVSLMSTIAPYGCTASTRANYDYGCYSGSNGNLCFQMVGNSTINTTTDWTNYLSEQYQNNTPVIVIYPKLTATTETVTGQFLSKEPVTVTGSLTGLVANVVSSTHTTPTPQQPLPINCNNGVIKYGYTTKNLNVGTLDNQGYTSTGGTSTSTTFCGTLWKIKVREGEKYTVSYGNFPDGISGVFVNTWETDGTWNLRQAISISSAYTYTIPEGIGEVNFTLYKTGGITIASNSWIQVEKGNTATAYVPAGYGLLTEGTVETVGVFGNNMFNKNDTANIGNWYSGSNQTIAQAAANETLVMRAKPSTTYYFKHCSVKGGCRAFYTEVEDWEIGSACSTMSGNASANANVVYSITTSANAKWIFFNCGRNNLETSFDDQRNDFMVSTLELTSDTPYEPYFNGGSATAEMLLKVGDYQDVQSILDGAVTRNVGIKVFDGSENFGTSNATFTYAVSDRVKAKTSLICSHFEYSTKTSSQVEDLKIISFSSTNIGFRYDACANTTAFKAWLKSQYDNGAPVIIVYPLATATTETVTPQPLTIQAGTNVVAITQASIDDLELEVSYKAGVEVTVTEIENAQLDNSVEVTING